MRNRLDAHSEEICKHKMNRQRFHNMIISVNKTLSPSTKQKSLPVQPTEFSVDFGFFCDGRKLMLKELSCKGSAQLLSRV